jgi:hypothetical protein
LNTRVDGESDFDGLHSRKFDDAVHVDAFDALARGRRPAPAAAQAAAAAAVPAIFVAPFEQGEIWSVLFRKACEFGLEGMVSKHRGADLPRRAIAELGEGEEPEPSSDDEGQTGIFVVGDHPREYLSHYFSWAPSARRALFSISGCA